MNKQLVYYRQQLIATLKKSHPGLNVRRVEVYRTMRGIESIRFKKNCGITFTEFREVLRVTPSPVELSGSNSYESVNVKINSKLIPVSFETSEVSQKEFTPNKLSLQGKWDNAESFKQKIVSELIRLGYNSSVIESLIGLLESVVTQKAASEQRLLSPENITKLESDFGEVICMYYSLVQGKSIIVPKASNSMTFDYWEETIPVSVKSLKLQVNLVLFKDQIPLDTDLGILLFSLASHNQGLFFETLKKVCPVCQKILQFIGGLTENDFKRFVNTHSYDDFFNFISSLRESKSKRGKILGVPKRETGVRMWSNGSTNPIKFCLLTIFCHLSKSNLVDSLTKIAEKILPPAIFYKIKINEGVARIDSLPFEEVQKWGLSYWSNCSKPFNNYPGLSAI